MQSELCLLDMGDYSYIILSFNALQWPALKVYSKWAAALI